MKKVVSLLAAFATVIGMGTTAFAADTVNVVDNADNNYGSTTLTGDPNTRVSHGTSGDTVSVAQNEILIVENNNTNAIIRPETYLKPGTEYSFKIFVATDALNNIDPNSTYDQIVPLTESMLGGGKFRLRGRSGTSTITTAKVVKRGTGATATYRLDITTKESWGTKETDVEYLISVISQTTGDGLDFSDGSLTFKTGYAQMSDDMIDQYGEGDTITIDEDFPVIKKAQFDEIARNFNYKAVQFEAESGLWSYLGRVSGMGDSNFTFSRDVIAAIANKFEDQEFEFLTFGAGVNFPTNGEMRIDVSDYSDTYTRMYAYLYRNGRLTPISTTYDTGADELVFRTNYLGSFVITNEQITDTTIIEQENPQLPAEEDNNGTGVGNNNNENPDTGATAGMNVAVALGLAALVAAGAVSRKK